MVQRLRLYNHNAGDPGLDPWSENQIPHATRKAAAAAAAKSLQSCPTLCDLIDSSPSGSSVRGVFQARVMEWVAIAFSNRDRMHLKFPLSTALVVISIF